MKWNAYFIYFGFPRNVMWLIWYFSVWIQGLETEHASARPNAGIKGDKRLVDVLQGKLCYMYLRFKSHKIILNFAVN